MLRQGAPYFSRMLIPIFNIRLVCCWALSLPLSSKRLSQCLACWSFPFNRWRCGGHEVASVEVESLCFLLGLARWALAYESASL